MHEPPCRMLGICELGISTFQENFSVDLHGVCYDFTRLMGKAKVAVMFCVMNACDARGNERAG